ncbi:MAG: hypothetical protein EON58_02510 [Alphaproteobacteria bacterium]|nr:MAG: hypothetical protein EON58_02510 [Alphaproteobacteria bacterium]
MMFALAALLFSDIEPGLYGVARSIPYPGFDHFVPTPWKDRVAFEYYRRAPNERQDETRVRLLDRNGRTLSDNLVPEGWTAASFDKSGRRRDFFLADDSVEPSESLPHRTNYGYPLFAHDFRFLFREAFLAIGDDGRIATMWGDYGTTAVAASSSGGTLLSLEFKGERIEMRWSDSPGEWSHRELSLAPFGSPQDPGLSLALNSYGECFFVSSVDVPEKGESATKQSVYRCDLKTGKLEPIVASNTPSSPRLVAGTMDTFVPRRTQLYTPPNSRDLVFNSGGEFLWLSPRSQKPRKERN